VLTITEHDAAWLAAAGIDQAPTRTALVLDAARHMLVTAAWLVLAAAIIVAFWSGVIAAIIPAAGWIATGIATGAHAALTWVWGVATSW
jgi:hypothetical protein